MSDQLKYCTSIQFYERCHQAANTSQHAYIQSRVAQAFAKCLESTTEDVAAVLESVLDVIDWSDLFFNHHQRHADHGADAGSVTTALRDVCDAISSVLTRSILRECGVIALLKIWSSQRISSNESVWSFADQYMIQFISTLLVHSKSQSASFDRHEDLMLWCSLIEECTNRFSLQIESVFAINPSTELKDDFADLSLHASNVDFNNALTSEKEKLTVALRSWIQLLRDMSKQSAKLTNAFSDALLHILRAIDDIDIQNNCYLETLEYNGQNRNFKGGIDSYNNPDKRPRRPPKACSLNFLEALHESSVNLGDNDRQQRAKWAQLERLSCTYTQITLQQVLNAPLSISGSKIRNEFSSHTAMKSNGNRFKKYATISTLTIEAALLRRDLYRYLVDLDSLEFGEIVQIENDCREKSVSDNITNTDDSKITQLISRLLSTLEKFSSSPSIRLYIVLTLDHLRELHLGDRGYQCFLSQLLISFQRYDCDEDRIIFLKIYAEIVAECDLYAKPMRLFSALSMLMAMALRNTQDNNWGMPLQAISHIMLRRRTIILRLNEYGIQGNADLKSFMDLASKMSLEYGSSTFWIHHSMRREEQEVLVAILQATGILSLFGIESEDVGYSSRSKGIPFPYPDHLSLRSAHTRLCPCTGYNNIMTHPLAYKCGSVKYHDSKVQYSCGQTYVPPPTYVDNDILNYIFDFLGYRSLARASQCCQAWRDASKSNDRWLRLYFYKFQGAMLEEEVVLNADSPYSLLRDRPLSYKCEERITFPKSLEGYDWNYLFRKKYFTEKMARARSLGKSTRFRSCRFVGCQDLLNERNLKSHWKKHAKNANIQSKRKEKLALLQQEFNTFDKRRCHDKIDLHDVFSPKEMSSPESILQYLVFPFLDARDLLQPICKLWAEFAECSFLWQKLYTHHFGAPSKKWLFPKTSSITWKDLFSLSFKMKNLALDDVNNFGWILKICPVCSAVLASKLEFDLHMMEHKVNYFKNQLKKKHANHSSNPKPAKKCKMDLLYSNIDIEYK